MRSDSSYDYRNKEHRMIVRKAVMKLGGAIYSESSYLPYFIPYLYSADFGTPSEMVQLINGLMFSVKYLLDDMNEADLFTATDSLAIPFYIFQGTEDLQTPHSEAKRLFNSIHAPEKQFFSYVEAAHNPHFEKPEMFNRELLSIMHKIQKE